jgi:hypothetical protein
VDGGDRDKDIETKTRRGHRNKDIERRTGKEGDRVNVRWIQEITRMYPVLLKHGLFLT